MKKFSVLVRFYEVNRCGADLVTSIDEWEAWAVSKREAWAVAQKFAADHPVEVFEHLGSPQPVWVGPVTNAEADGRVRASAAYREARARRGI